MRRTEEQTEDRRGDWASYFPRANIQENPSVLKDWKKLIPALRLGGAISKKKMLSLLLAVGLTTGMSSQISRQSPTGACNNTSGCAPRNVLDSAEGNSITENTADGLTFQVFDYPNGARARLVGISDSGIVLGFFEKTYPNEFFGGAPQIFIYDHGKFTELHGPLFDPVYDTRREGLLIRTYPVAIDSTGQILIDQHTGTDIAGTIYDDRVSYFLYKVKEGTFRRVGTNGQLTLEGKVSNVELNDVFDFNDKGQIVGSVGLAYSRSAVYGTPALGPVGSTAPPIGSGSFTQVPRARAVSECRRPLESII